MKLFQCIASDGREILIEQINYGLSIINRSGTFDSSEICLLSNLLAVISLMSRKDIFFLC